MTRGKKGMVNWLLQHGFVPTWVDKFSTRPRPNFTCNETDFVFVAMILGGKWQQPVPRRDMDVHMSASAFWLWCGVLAKASVFKMLIIVPLQSGVKTLVAMFIGWTQQ